MHVFAEQIRGGGPRPYLCRPVARGDTPYTWQLRKRALHYLSLSRSYNVTSPTAPTPCSCPFLTISFSPYFSTCILTNAALLLICSALITTVIYRCIVYTLSFCCYAVHRGRVGQTGEWIVLLHDGKKRVEDWKWANKGRVYVPLHTSDSYFYTPPTL